MADAEMITNWHVKTVNYDFFLSVVVGSLKLTIHLNLQYIVYQQLKILLLKSINY